MAIHLALSYKSLKIYMKAHITSILLILTGALSYAQTPIDTAVFELQKIALKLCGETEETCIQIINEETEALSKALEQIRDYYYFQESRTIKLLKLEVQGDNLRAQSIPFLMPSPLPPNTFSGIHTKAQESSILESGHYPAGNHIWCTLHKQCTGKKHEQLSIAFYQTFQDEHKNLGEYRHDTPTEEPAIKEYRNKLALAGLMQLCSAAVYQMRTPLSSIQQSVASLAALLTTYFLLTPYDCLSGASMNLPELSLEFGAFTLALAGSHYINSAPLLPTEAIALWLTYIILGSLQSSGLWYFSNEKIDSVQQWLNENGEKLTYAVLGTELLATIFQALEYQYYQYNIRVQERNMQHRLLIIDTGARAALQLLQNQGR